MKILIATSNPHKLGEIRAIFDDCAAHAGSSTAGRAIELVGLNDLGLASPLPEPVEDGDTFEANALTKARYYAAATGELCLADDSGLEVDALGGAPGVRSARYAGVDGPREVVDRANNALLLRNLSDVPVERRTARFVCAMALVLPPEVSSTNSELETRNSELPPPLALLRGTVEGRILTPAEAADPSQPHQGRGEHGFGYDPLFFLPTLGLTTAELSPQRKNALSHRGAAARLMFAELRRLWPEG